MTSDKDIWLWIWGHIYDNDNEYTSDNDREYTFDDNVDAHKDYWSSGTPPWRMGLSPLDPLFICRFPSSSWTRFSIRNSAVLTQFWGPVTVTILEARKVHSCLQRNSWGTCFESQGCTFPSCWSGCLHRCKKNIYIELCLRQIVPFPQSTLALPCFVIYFGSSLHYAIESPCPNIVFLIHMALSVQQCIHLSIDYNASMP